MTDLPQAVQHPSPGGTSVVFCGDVVRFTLTLSRETAGEAWIRTNFGNAAVSRRETIERTEKNEIALNGGWYDIKMAGDGSRSYAVVLPLQEVGHFQAKCFFLPEESVVPVWPEGPNTVINVEPAGTCSANIIYNAFVRQFGKYADGPGEDAATVSRIEHLDKKGYTVIPASGKFRDVKEKVGFVFGELGCRALHLLPVYPTPTTYARMGRFGSPYAALNFTDVDPALARFDVLATPLEQFMELADTVHYYNGHLILDIAINHTGWGAAIHEKHPEWLVRDEDGRIEVPGAWGVVWEDLTRLDYSNTDLWQYMADIFLLWCSRGVDGFRCDAGYMIPVATWVYIVAKVREQYPDTLFILEGLGGPLETTCTILDRASFNWAYSELFQNYDRVQIEQYMVTAWEMSEKYGHMINYAETHDNPRLAAVSKTYAKMRTALCALLSVCGGFGFANGVEWFATEKIDVHEANSLNWGVADNQVAHISRLNLILKRHPVFSDNTELTFVHRGEADAVALLRYNVPTGRRLLVLANLDCGRGQPVCWDRGRTGIDAVRLYDLVSGEGMDIGVSGDEAFLEVEAGRVLALTPDRADLDRLDETDTLKSRTPERVLRQKLKAKVLSVYTALNGYGDVGHLDTDGAARLLAADPVELVRSLNSRSAESPVIVMEWEEDTRRQVMVPPGFFLMVVSRANFRAELVERKPTGTEMTLGYEKAFPTAGEEKFFALFSPADTAERQRECVLKMRVFHEDSIAVTESAVIFLAPYECLYINSSFARSRIVNDPSLKHIETNDRGGMMRAAAWWGRLESRYDALIAANLSRDFPENRWIMLSRFRIWAIYQGYSRELAPDCLAMFSYSFGSGALWRFHVPTSEGSYFPLELSLTASPRDNAVRLRILRKGDGGEKALLADTKAVTVIIRPDIEDRSFHETVKAWTGPETAWRKAVRTRPSGFFFEPDENRRLCVTVSEGTFHFADEWHYMVHHPLEAGRGLDPDSDLYSPGYFKVFLKGDAAVDVCACAATADEEPEQILRCMAADGRRPEPARFTLMDAAAASLDAFVVGREGENSVIAGYPWFLDWGRDSLIFCRSLIELGRLDEAKGILRLFGKYEMAGTLPNMICGIDAANRETSDAPLWFFAACRELVEKENSPVFLKESLGGRTVQEILVSIAAAYRRGTNTGVLMDGRTGLVYSPAHYTWMDTNFPAASPRQGYPVEIQALWHYALTFLAKIDRSEDWGGMASKVKTAVRDLFFLEERGYFSDCLHADGPAGASQAEADDALRPNQLLLLTLGVAEDEPRCIAAVESCTTLLVPGAIRSLADRRLTHPLEITHQGRMIKDPHHPYAGTYAGDEDTRRKPAYHNGTAWTWQFPVFCEAWATVFGRPGYPASLAWLGSAARLMKKGAAGYMPEIVDGDAPHTPRGCDAQAWGSSELARVLHKLLNGQGRH